MNVTAQSIAVAPPGPALQAFIDARRVEPWPLEYAQEAGARASALYDAYVEVMKADDRLVLSSRDFGLTLQSAGFEPSRGDENTRVYRGLFPRTREEVAEAVVAEELAEVEFSRLFKGAEERHMASYDHGTTAVPVLNPDGTPMLRPDDTLVTDEVANPCACPFGTLVDEVWADVHAYIDTCEADGTIARLVEERFGAFLRWREGDPDPRDAIRVRQYHRAEKELAKVTAQLESEGLPRFESDRLRRRESDLRDEVRTMHEYLVEDGLL